MIDALPHGKRNAKKKLTLAVELDWYTETGKPDTRAVETAIERLRLDGVPVCSSGNGYWIAESAADALAFERAQARRIRSMLATLRGVRRWRRGVERAGQAELWAA